jgi:pimeloyl-ACP methyl ester carboxylesterase
MATLTTEAGQTVGYSDHGGDGPPLVLLHALMMDRSMFAPQVEAFGATHRVVTIDARGHGASATAEPFTLWDVADDVVAVLDHLGIEGATLAGTSQGGIVALRVALRRPELAAALVLMGTSADTDPPEVVETLRGIPAAWRQFGPADPLIEQMTGAVLGAYPGAAPWQDLWRTLDADTVERNIEAVVGRDAVIDRLAELPTPALVLHGSADAVFAVAEAEKLAAALPGATDPIVIDAGAHFLSLTDPEAVNARLAEFLGG